MAIRWTRHLTLKSGVPKKRYDMAHTPSDQFKSSEWNDGDETNVHITAGHFGWSEPIRFTSGGSFKLRKQIGEMLSKLAHKDNGTGVIEFLIEDVRTLDSVGAQFHERVRRSLKDSAGARRARLAAKLAANNTKPLKKNHPTTIFDRDADVVAEVLVRANGKCERCQDNAPFCRPNGEPYLEVHHLVWLSKDGDDMPGNAIALCPNCHREAHYGDTEKWRRKLPPQFRKKKISTQ